MLQSKVGVNDIYSQYDVSKIVKELSKETFDPMIKAKKHWKIARVKIMAYVAFLTDSDIS